MKINKMDAIYFSNICQKEYKSEHFWIFIITTKCNAVYPL